MQKLHKSHMAMKKGLYETVVCESYNFEFVCMFDSEIFTIQNECSGTPVMFFFFFPV